MAPRLGPGRVGNQTGAGYIPVKGVYFTGFTKVGD